jgi:hypothetical protein
LVFSTDGSEQFAGAWALAWIGDRDLKDLGLNPSVLERLFALWQEARILEMRRVAAWAFSALPLHQRSPEPLCNPETRRKFVSRAEDYVNRPETDFEPQAALMAGYYLGAPWSDAELADRTRRVLKGHSTTGGVRDLVVALGLTLPGGARPNNKTKRRRGREQPPS